jgi:hypothetical protein
MRAKYKIIIPLVIVGVTVVSRIVYFFEDSRQEVARSIVDFDVFYLVAQMVWRGEIEKAYYFATMGPAQEALAGQKIFMPWTYPPQFNLLIAPLKVMPLGAAYSIFVVGTLISYLVVLRAVAGKCFSLALLLLLPIFIVTVAIGQNGFLTGTFIGLVCLYVHRSNAVAGIALGLMIIKPHLAVAFAVYTLWARRWAVATAAIVTIAVTSILATVLLGIGVWSAFFDSMKEAQSHLGMGMYPLFRMVSPYAALYTLGMPAMVAWVVQILIATMSLMLVCVTHHRGFTAQQTLGLTAIVSLLISPYAYDYDLTIYGIGLAMLLPDLTRLGGRFELATLYCLSFLIGVFGLAQTQLRMTFFDGDMPATLAGPALIALLALVWHILGRQQKSSSHGQTKDS